MLAYIASFAASFAINYLVFWLGAERLPQPKPWWAWPAIAVLFCVGWVAIVSIGILFSSDETSPTTLSMVAVIAMILAGSTRRWRSPRS